MSDTMRKIYELALRELDIAPVNDFPKLYHKTVDARIGIAGNETRGSTTIPEPKILTVNLPHSYRLLEYAWVQQTSGTVYMTFCRRNNQDGSRPSEEDTGKWKRIKIQDDEHYSRLAIQINWPFKASMQSAVLEWDNWVVAYRVILPTN